MRVIFLFLFLLASFHTFSVIFLSFSILNLSFFDNFLTKSFTLCLFIISFWRSFFSFYDVQLNTFQIPSFSFPLFSLSRQLLHSNFSSSPSQQKTTHTTQYNTIHHNTIHTHTSTITITNHAKHYSLHYFFRWVCGSNPSTFPCWSPVSCGERFRS